MDREVDNVEAAIVGQAAAVYLGCRMYACGRRVHNNVGAIYKYKQELVFAHIFKITRTG